MKIFLLGSVAFDEVSRFPGKFSDAIKAEHIHKLSVSFVVFEKEKFFGGCAGNVAYSLGLLRTPAYLCTLIGDDAEKYVKEMKKWGMNTKYLKKLAGHTPLAFITSDAEQNQIAHFAPGVLALPEKFSLPKEAEKGDVLLLSPENHDRMMDAVGQGKKRGMQVFFDPGQMIHAFQKEELKKILSRIEGLFVNDYEWELLQSISGLSRAEIIKSVAVIFITKGADGVDLIEHGKQSHIPAYKVSPCVDPTGAGDAFRAGVLASLKQGLFYKSAAKVGALMGAISVRHKQCQGHLIGSVEARELKKLGFSL